MPTSALHSDAEMGEISYIPLLLGHIKNPIYTRLTTHQLTAEEFTLGKLRVNFTVDSLKVVESGAFQASCGKHLLPEYAQLLVGTAEMDTDELVAVANFQLQLPYLWMMQRADENQNFHPVKIIDVLSDDRISR
ncbi:unnamed protein product [Protopolystoma xenopodis]|uniref:Uncharacterized protein n=1 Tax=Protopolystoma xenopodis TaxID=117903 RepID=A0A3S5FGV6_9PLAT|nr:unnamed protein product [Protopolystoma xenopodis]